jgi:hypothetical protein
VVIQLNALNNELTLKTSYYISKTNIIGKMINNGKAKIENTISRLIISIPSKKNWFALIFGTAWLGGWYFGFKSAASTLLSSGTDNLGANGFLIFWLIGWSVGGLAIISILLWGYFGLEQLISNNGEVYLNKTIFGIGLKKRMETNEIKNIRTELSNGNMFGNNRSAIWGLGPGKIKFDYGFKTYTFGLGVDDAEAEYLVQIMQGHFKH